MLTPREGRRELAPGEKVLGSWSGPQRASSQLRVPAKSMSSECPPTGGPVGGGSAWDSHPSASNQRPTPDSRDACVPVEGEFVARML